MEGGLCNVRIFVSGEPQFDDFAAMGEGAADVFNGGAQRWANAYVAQSLKVTAQGALTAIEQTVGQVFQREQSALLESLVANAHESMPAQSRNAPGFADRQIRERILQSKCDNDLSDTCPAPVREGLRGKRLGAGV